MRKSITLAAIITTLSVLSISFAHAADTKMLVPKPVSTPVEPSHGEVKNVDLATKTITIKHGPINNLGMPAMAMSFGVSDPAMLKQIKAGDKVDFVADIVNGMVLITRIEKLK